MSQIEDKFRENISKIADSDDIELIKEESDCNPFNSDNTNNPNYDINNELRPFKCHFLICNKDYNNKSRLEIHLRTHVYILIFKYFEISLFSKFFPSNNIFLQK